MGKLPLIIKLKNILYPLAECFYLWCVGYKNLDDYTEAVIDWEQARGTIKRITNSTQQ